VRAYTSSNTTNARAGVGYVTTGEGCVQREAGSFASLAELVKV
jgi:hypothetical protein